MREENNNGISAIRMYKGIEGDSDEKGGRNNILQMKKEQEKKKETLLHPEFVSVCNAGSFCYITT